MTRRAPVRYSLIPALLLLLAPAASVLAQGVDCEDVDHDCPADADVRRAISRGGRDMIRCMRNGISPCDLTEALADITSPECHNALECELNALRNLLGDGSTPCVQQLFRQARRFMVNKVRRVDRERLELVPADLQRCKDRGGLRCDDPIAPALTDACVGQTTPTAGAACVCDFADEHSNNLLLTPATCTLTPPPAAATQFRSLAASTRPNIVLILTDDQRWDTVDATHAPLTGPRAGQPIMPIVTSELVSDGITFRQGHVTTALCCPSRSSILAGQYAHNTGVLTNGGTTGGADQFDDSSTIATWLRDAGYRTGFVGKYLNGYNALAPCVPPGWDEWHVFEQVKFYDYDFVDVVDGYGGVTHYGDESDPANYSQTVLTDRAVQFILNAAGQPFYLQVNTKAPHGPATPAPPDIGLFAGLPPFRPSNYAESNVSDKPAWVQALTWDTRDCSTCPTGVTCDACSTDLFRIDQLESLQAVDRAVGELMDALRTIGEENNTLVIFTSDNAFSWGAHRWRPKMCPYEECMHVPMIAHFPSMITTPRTDDRFVLNVDFAATFLDLANATVPAGHVLNGQSLVPLFSGAPVTWRDDMLNEHWGGNIPDNALVKEGRCSASLTTVCESNANCTTGMGTCHIWKYVEYETAETELYDLTADPFELTNVTTNTAYTALKASLKARLDQLKAD
jgi:arylsulfatase A-like enzyme